MRLPAVGVLAALFISALPALAASGDLAAVERYCGTPTGEHQDVSPATSKMERDLLYGSITLHFLPVENGWTFLSGWYGHLPLTQKSAGEHMPCFAQAMASVNADTPAEKPAYEDPAIREQTAPQSADTRDFGIPHLRLILVLSLVVCLCFFLPARRRQVPRSAVAEPLRYQRKPLLGRFLRRGAAGRVDL